MTIFQRHSFYIIGLSLFSNNALAMNNYTQGFFTKHLSSSKPKISSAQFKELATYTNGFLQENLNRLACQKNESGFVRVNVPLTKNIKSQFDGIEKIRLNYWSPRTGIAIRPESIHTHPTYFESYLVKGGYTHATYANGDKDDMAYDLYRIFKDKGEKSFAFIGKSKLKFIKNESFEKNKIITFDKDLIHKVIYTKPETLTVNVIFDQMAQEDKDKDYYNVYLTKNGSLDDVKTTREMIPNDISKPLIYTMISYLSKATGN